MIKLGYSSLSDVRLGDNQISAIYAGEVMIFPYGVLPPHCIKFSANAEQTVSLTTYSNANGPTLEYSYDTINWSSWTYTALTFGVINERKKPVYIRGKNTSGFTTSSDNYSTFTFGNDSVPVSVGGNVMSLIDWENLPQTAPCGYCFKRLFADAVALTCIDKDFLDLSAVTGSYTFASMFNGCTNLVNAPDIKVTTTAGGTCSSMFRDCASLTTTPSIANVNSGNECCAAMFYGCSALTDASNVAVSGYVYQYACQNMFYGCSSLTGAPVMSGITSISQNGCQYMFYGCTSLVTPPTMPSDAITVGNSGCYGMFNNCVALLRSAGIKCNSMGTEAFREMYSNDKAITAATDYIGCNINIAGCKHMYNYCQALKTVPENMFSGSTTINDSGCTAMFYQCRKLTTPPTLSAMTSIGKGGCWSMFQSCVAFSRSSDMSNVTRYDTKACDSMYNACTTMKTVVGKIQGACIDGYNFQSMFYHCYKINSIPSDYLSSITNLANYCFQSMFNGDGSFATAPELPALNSSKISYCNSMFQGCSGMTTGPSVLPATVLASTCYQNMFYGCKKLVTAPVICATTVGESSCKQMFAYCSALKTTQSALPATELNTSSYQNMFIGCSSLTQAPNLPATSVTVSAYQQMFQGCTSLVTAPVICATTLNTSSCYQMFASATSLTTVPSLPFVNVKGVTGAASMFRGCTALVNVPVCIPATALTSNCFGSMFQDCTSLTKAPALCATTMVENCYQSMFKNCSSLTSITCFAEDVTAITSCTANWAVGVASAGTFTGNKSAGWSIDSANGVPVGWTPSWLDFYVYFNITNGSVKIPSSGTYEYSYDGINWTEATAGKSFVSASFYLRGKNNTSVGNFTINGNIGLEGNALALLGGNVESVPASGFYGTFKNCTGLTSVTSDFLTATTLGVSAYNNMFYGCTNLTNAPELPASALADYCYQYMFYGCEGLVSPPAMSATTLATKCCDSMFQNCTSLKNAPHLYAETLVSYCYYWMFYGCESLTSITCDATNISAEGCTEQWVNSVASTGMFRGNESAGWTLNSVNGVPIGWTPCWQCYFNITSGQVTLPSAGSFEYSTDKVTWSTATASQSFTSSFYLRGKNSTVGQFGVTGSVGIEGSVMALIDYETIPDTVSANAFEYTFSGCTGLTSVSEGLLPATTLGNSCYRHMFYGCKSLTVAPILPATVLSESCYYGMFLGCDSLVTAPAIYATTLAKYCCYFMFLGCDSLVNAPELFATAVTTSCYYGMFSDCTSLVKAPVLSAETLETGCYYEMFDGCSSLSSITCLAKDITATDCTTNWVHNVASAGTFNGYKSTGWEIDSTKGIPVGWTPSWIETDYVYFDLGSKSKVALPSTGTFEYSTDKIEWSATTGSQVLTSSFYLRGTNSTVGMFKMSGETSLSGNIMTLIDWKTLPVTVPTNAFNSTFYSCTAITSISDSFLSSATTLGETCYYNMFYGCTSLKNAPALPATALSRSCYYEMFNGCTSLTNAPTLPASVMNYKCYYGMFQGCKSLQSAPSLPSTTLSGSCYTNMFSGCTSLTTAPALPATSASSCCYSNMFQGCTSLISMPTISMTEAASNCCYQMFQGCTSLVNTSTLLPSTLDEYSYYQMFCGCTSLVTAPVICATTMGYRSCKEMFKGCTSLKTVPYALVATSISSETYEYMFRNCTALETPPSVICATTIDENACWGMFYNCQKLATAPALCFTAVGEFGCWGMFYRCYSLTDSPIIPNATLSNFCYEKMFLECTALTSVTCYATDVTTLTSSTSNWLSGVASAGTFSGVSTAGWVLNSANGIPVGWTPNWVFPTYFGITSGQVTLPSSVAYQYSYDGGTWSSATPSQTFTSSFYLRGTNSTVGQFGITGSVSLSGNAMALLSYTTELTSVPENAFSNAFKFCTGLTSVSSDFLTATTLNSTCYYNMFLGCTSLESIPDLPAETLAYGCYQAMFSGCSALRSASIVLPATTAAEGCYYAMFYGCTSLTAAPVICATTLAQFCCCNMFQNCTSLVNAPVLPATTLAAYCYGGMFAMCSLLSSVTCYATNISAESCTDSWLYLVASSGTFTGYKSAGWTTDSDSGIPTNWTKVWLD